MTRRVRARPGGPLGASGTGRWT